MKEKIENRLIPTIKYDSKIAENALFLDENHQNEVAKKLDSLTLDKPIFLMRKNPDNLADEGLEVTEKILNFLKENKEKYGDMFNYDLYINYSFTGVLYLEDLDSDEDVCIYIPISEDTFMKSEMKWWETEKEEGVFKKLTNPIMEAIKDFHNKKWHNGEKFWK